MLMKSPLNMLKSNQMLNPLINQNILHEFKGEQFQFFFFEPNKSPLQSTWVWQLFYTIYVYISFLCNMHQYSTFTLYNKFPLKALQILWFFALFFFLCVKIDTEASFSLYFCCIERKKNKILIFFFHFYMTI